MLNVTLLGPYEQAARDAIDVGSPGGLHRKWHVERLMGRDPALRFEFIQNSAAAVDEGAIDA